jgi:hypothetical protein
MSSFFALNIQEFVRNRDGTFSLKYVSEIMCKILNIFLPQNQMLTIWAVSVTIVVVAISLFFGFFWDFFLKSLTSCKDLLRRFGRKSKKFFISTLEILGVVIVMPFAYVLRMISVRRTVWFEEVRERRSERKRSESLSDSDEEIVIEISSPPRHGRREYRRGRSYRSSSSKSHSMFAGLFSLFRLNSKSDTVVERYSRRRSGPPRRYQTGWFGGRQRRRTETMIIEEHNPRRRSTSSIRRWYGDDERRPAPERRNWLPWSWSKKTPAPARRSREIRVENDSGPTGLNRIYAWFISHLITALLKLFGITKQTSAERASDSSSSFSYEYGSGTNSHVSNSARDSDARSRRTHRSRRS